MRANSHVDRPIDQEGLTLSQGTLEIPWSVRVSNLELVIDPSQSATSSTCEKMPKIPFVMAGGKVIPRGGMRTNQLEDATIKT